MRTCIGLLSENHLYHNRIITLRVDICLMVYSERQFIVAAVDAELELDDRIDAGCRAYIIGCNIFRAQRCCPWIPPCSTRSGYIANAVEL